MPNQIKAMAAKFKQQRILKRRAYIVLASLAVAVTVGTVWALVQPAVAMTGKPVCGVEEHTHTEQCFRQQLICGQEEGQSHGHTEACWSRELVCPLTEHTHAAECYGSVEPDGAASQPTEQPEGSTTTPTAGQPDSTVPPQTEPSPTTDTAPAETVETTPGETTDTVPSETEQTVPEETTETVPEDTTEATEPTEEILIADQLPREIPETYTDVRTAQLLDGKTVSVYALPDTIAADVTLKVELLDESGEEFSRAVEQLQMDGVPYDFVKALDISLRNDQNEEVEPSAPVYVVMDAGALLPPEADRKTIQVQHHTELPEPLIDLLMPEETDRASIPNVELEVVLDQARGLLAGAEENGSCMITFPVDSFSVFTITSQGWRELMIQVQCVDEREQELAAVGADVVLGDNFTSGVNFDIVFSDEANANGVAKIDGYVFDNKAYYMKNGEYQAKIFGLRREGGQWYYYPESNKANKILFSPQPDFGAEVSKDFIRLIYKQKFEIPVLYVDDDVNGSQPLPDGAVNGGGSRGMLLVKGQELDPSDIGALPVFSGYFYVGSAFIGEQTPANEVYSVIRKDGSPYAVTADKREILLEEDNPLKLVYHQNQKNPGRISTVSTREKGLVINLFDYNTGLNCGPNDGINAGKKLQFTKDRSRPDGYNRYTGVDGGLYTGIVEATLQGDYPVIARESLNYLFDPSLARSALGSTVKHVHTDLDHLFWQDKDGYYRYDSMTNFATIMDPETPGGESTHQEGNTEGGNFVVYNQPALPGLPASGDNPKFLPFNTYNEANRPNATYESIKEYHFGMTMSAEFLIPPGGEVVDLEGSHTGLRDMIFEFNGDDDVWVFIDGKLALDLGGIHGRYTGRINFRTGEVTTNAPPTEHSGRRQPNLYGITSGADQMTPEQLAVARADAGFGDYTEHKFQFFYLERGRGASNCAIRFNLVPASHSLVVGKRLPMKDNVQVSPTDHMWYKFRAETANYKSGAAGERRPLANAPFTVLKWIPNADAVTGSGIPIRPGVTDSDGYFWLRAGERAQFTDVIDLKEAGNAPGTQDDIPIYVSEIIPQNAGVQNVTAWTGSTEIGGSYKEIRDKNGKTIKVVPPLYDAPGESFHNPKTKVPLTPSGAAGGETCYEAELHCGMLNKFNWVDFENQLGETASLNITKHAVQTDDNTPVTGVSFPIKVEFWDAMRNEWEPMEAGSPYWLLQPEQEEPTADQKPQYLSWGTEGLISIQHGQTLHFKLLPGTRYKVSEVLSPEDAVMYDTSYSVIIKDLEGQIDEAAQDDITHYSENGKWTGIAAGRGVAPGSSHRVKIVNHSNGVITPKGAFSLTKKVRGILLPEEDGKPPKFDFRLGIPGYPADGAGPAEGIACVATYHQTPKVIWPRENAQQNANGLWEQQITFQKDSSGNWISNIFLYPGETVVITGLPEGYPISAEEVLPEGEADKYAVTFQEEKQPAVPGLKLEQTAAKIHPNHVIKVTCTNESRLQSASTLKITKQVKRTDVPNGAPTMMDRSRAFDFSITLKNPVGFAGNAEQAEVAAELQTESGPQSVLLKFEKSGSDYFVKNVKLKHGQTLTVPNLPNDIDVVVTESNYKGYVVSMNETPGASTTVHLQINTGKPYEVLCVNMTGVELPETGGHGVLPYYLIAGMLMSAAAVLLYQRRKQHGKTA